MPVTIYQGPGAVVAAREAAKAGATDSSAVRVVNLATAGREAFALVERHAADREVILVLPDGWYFGGHSGDGITLRKPDGTVTLAAHRSAVRVVGQEPVSSRVRQMLMLGAGP